MNIDKELEKSSLQYWTESVKAWRQAMATGGMKSLVMRHLNRSRRNLARAVREAETKLNRPHRYLPKLGCVQYMGDGK